MIGSKIYSRFYIAACLQIPRYSPPLKTRGSHDLMIMLDHPISGKSLPCRSQSGPAFTAKMWSTNSKHLPVQTELIREKLTCRVCELSLQGCLNLCILRSCLLLVIRRVRPEISPQFNYHRPLAVVYREQLCKLKQFLSVSQRTLSWIWPE